MKNLFLNLLAFLLFQSSFGQNIVGEWNNIDPETQKVNSTITITKRGNEYFGAITHISNPAKRNEICTKCKGDLKGKPMLGLEILRNLKKNDDIFDGGKILDPKSGKDYKCKIWVDEDDANTLNVRGYIGFFYSTRTWVRKK
ncbi:MAG: DUF2147 domain-containing protein [Flavobacteriales bacterium]|nr:DUF2147 domain-containing protein [Flavobacteriales bacterium]